MTMQFDREPPHFLKPLKSTTVPQRLVWFDCAALSRKEGGVFVHRWLCAAAGTTHHTSRAHNRVNTLDTYDDPAAMWEMIDGFCGSNRRVVAFCYGLDYQLRVSNALVELPRLGWRLGRIALERQSAWVTFREGKRSLLICDIRSWCPVDFGRIASAAGLARAADREHRAGRDYRARVCRWRCEVLRSAVGSVLAWVQCEGLGPFRPTGSGQSYAAFRRRFMRARLLVHDDVRRLAAEREAMWTGRCEAWRHGRVTQGPFTEYDLHSAYATIAAECAVPTIALEHLTHPEGIPAPDVSSDRAALMRVTVTTDTPCLPTRHEGRVIWPTGTFTSWVWSHELYAVWRDLQHVHVHEAYLYDTAPALAEFGRYVLDGLREGYWRPNDVPSLVMKHWSRCMIGRLGLRYRAWERFATMPDSDVRLVSYMDSDNGRVTDLLIAGHDWLLLADMSEALESLPQIPSYIMAECRVRLWQAIRHIGYDRTVYMDTDSLIVQSGGRAADAVDREWLTSNGWVVKGAHPWITINSPRNLEYAGIRRVSGLPLTARRTGPLEYTGEIMTSVKESIRNGNLGEVVEHPRTFRLNAVDTRRMHLPGHATAPIHLSNTPTQPEVSS